MVFFQEGLHLCPRFYFGKMTKASTIGILGILTLVFLSIWTQREITSGAQVFTITNHLQISDEVLDREDIILPDIRFEEGIPIARTPFPDLFFPEEKSGFEEEVDSSSKKQPLSNRAAFFSQDDVLFVGRQRPPPFSHHFSWCPVELYLLFHALKVDC